MNNKKTSVSAPADGTGDGETRVEIERRIIDSRVENREAKDAVLEVN
ncbi:MAG: hypothetical protein Q7J68_04450 [Thermoplasmata archaeon]|nr:hypothetical protein [Thermoplasmata archaeon]